jgi:hypothetical protein
MIICRISKLKKRVNLDTQRLREKTLEGLEELFDLAQAMAKSNNVKFKQRQIWARIAAYIGQIMNSIAKGFDERHLNAELDEVERLINEARAKTKA